MKFEFHPIFKGLKFKPVNYLKMMKNVSRVSAPMVNCRNSPTRTCRFLSKNKGHSLW